MTVVPQFRRRKRTAKPTPKPAAKTKAKKSTKAEPKRTPNRSRHTTSLNGGQTVVIGATSRLGEADLPDGVRWLKKNRLGSLVASVDLWATGTPDDGDRWGACCLTHETTVRHATHRDAWARLPKSAEWCADCAAVAK